MIFTDLKNDKTRFTVTWNFLIDALKPEEAILLSLLIGIESIPMVKRIPTDPDFFEARLYALQSWEEEKIDDTLASLKSKKLIDYHSAVDCTGKRALVVKLNIDEIEKIKQKFLAKLDLQFAS